MNRERMEDLVAAWLDRTIAPEEGEELFDEMRRNAEARRYLLLASHTDLALYDLGRARAARRAPTRRRGRIVAAAAILIGLSIVGALYLTDRREPIARLQGSDAPLFEGDPVQGPAVAVGSDGTQLRAGPNTLLRLTTASEVFLEKGTLSARVTPQAPGRPRTFRTAQAEATVIGTLLKLVETPGSTRLEVEEGRVALKNLADRKTVDVRTGQFAVAAPGVELSARPLAAAAPPGVFAAPDGAATGDGSMEKPWDLSTALSAPKPGPTLWLRGGVYKGVFRSSLAGTASAPVVVRAFGRERVTIDGGIEARGAWTTFQGFEITNSSPDRSERRPPGLSLYGRGHKALNLIVHDTGNPGIGFRQDVGDGGEVSGCILWANGIYAGGQPVGSAISAQNRDGTRLLRDNIVFRNFQSGLFIFAEKGFADGFRVEGNVVFDHPGWGIVATGGENPLRRLRVADNFAFSRRQEAGDLIRLGLVPQARNEDAVVEGNTLVLGGSEEGLHLFQWKDVRVRRNTIFGRKWMARWTPGEAGARDWNDNTYFTDGPGEFLLPTARVGYSDWKVRTGFDADSVFNPWAPGGATVVVCPNAQEPGRAHVVVANWDRKPSVDADLSRVLQPGWSYVVRDAQNYHGVPVATGTYDGRPVSLPMAATAVALPVGDCPHLKGLFRPTAPEFAVFVVERGD